MFIPHPPTPLPPLAGAALSDDVLTVPPPPAPRRRPPIPWIASLVPVAGALVLWWVLASPFALWFAALGPLIAVAAAADGARAGRREQKEVRAVRADAAARVAREIERRHARERAERSAHWPDLAGYLQSPGELWRAVPGREGVIVAGAGEGVSALRIQGEEGDELADDLRARAAVLSDVPVAVPGSAGIAVRGPAWLAAAVARSLVLQLCCAHPPGALRLAAREPEAWTVALPHSAASAVVCHLDDRSAAERSAADMAVVIVPPDTPPPPHCRAVITVEDVTRARLDYAGRTMALEVTPLGEEQAERIAVSLAARAASWAGAGRVPDAVGFADLTGPHEIDARRVDQDRPAPRATDLRVAIARDADGAVAVDLVADGPHAVVTGTTGAGKSELLVTWVSRLCATRSTREVVFLLADFKGGSAFDALAALPHVTGVLTDLDGDGAERALQSLRAEIRHRERVLAEVGARDITHPGLELARLVIVVDEYAALLDAHRELGAVFADIAARGRGLGMHLLLGTQRATGVVRDALMANCALRVGLRVVDEADSRAVLGSDVAALLPGDAASRGLAYIRRAADAKPQLVRIARTSPSDIERIVEERRAEQRPRRPWQPALPVRIPLADLPTNGERPVIGLADEPDHQRQRSLRLEPGDAGLLVVGGPGSGKSTGLAAIAAQAADALWLPDDPEALWDALGALSAGPGNGELVIADDVDVLLTGFPADYAAAAAALLEHACRAARSQGRRFVMSTARVTGPVARIAELLPRRALLRLPNRLDHIAAGGHSAAYDPDAPAGRAVVGALRVQLPYTEVGPRPIADEPAAWHPERELCGFVIRPGADERRLRETLRGAGRDVVLLGETGVAAAIERGGAPVAVLGEPEQWQREWPVLHAVRSRGQLVVDASCAIEYRILTGDRALPPYCAPGRGRGWLLHDGAPPQRIVLPGIDPPRRRRAA
ncbi:FtsK/SpoIIIE domain-containing protein [Microbacterium sp. NPDC089189]|uniref:FtsK/SpoIIIE domain-containing protein n=1 Tax=Microbacterium sp. NPDC089189 TaxID=3154972 RepID=UPI003426D13C